MLKLYEISNAYNDFIRLVDDGEIDDPQAITDTLDSIEQEFDAKVDNIACLFKSLNAEADAIETEAKRQLERAKAKRNVCERLKAYVSENMKACRREKFENDRTRISFTSSKSLEITDENALFNALSAAGRLDLVRVEQVRKFDKSAIKKAINGGVSFDGATVNTNSNIQIK